MKVQEPERLRNKLIPKILSLFLYALFIYVALLIFKSRFSSGHFTLKMIQFLVLCNCISLFIFFYYDFHITDTFFPGMLKVHIIHLRGRK